MERSMIVCPSCGADNIAGADHCDECEYSLADLHLPIPATAVEQSLLRDRIRVLRPRRPITAGPSSTVREVLKLLADNAVGSVVIVEGNRPVGIFSEHDLLRRLGCSVREKGSEPISRYMTAPVQTLGEGDKIVFAVHRMDLGGYRHVPVVDASGALTGVISARDILRYLTDKLSQS